LSKPCPVAASRALRNVRAPTSRERRAREAAARQACFRRSAHDPAQSYRSSAHSRQNGFASCYSFSCTLRQLARSVRKHGVDCRSSTRLATRCECLKRRRRIGAVPGELRSGRIRPALARNTFARCMGCEAQRACARRTKWLRTTQLGHGWRDAHPPRHCGHTSSDRLPHLLRNAIRSCAHARKGAVSCRRWPIDSRAPVWSSCAVPQLALARCFTSSGRGDVSTARARRRAPCLCSLAALPPLMAAYRTLECRAQLQETRVSISNPSSVPLRQASRRGRHGRVPLAQARPKASTYSRSPAGAACTAAPSFGGQRRASPTRAYAFAVSI
jgi:hypothetical protein